MVYRTPFSMTSSSDGRHQNSSIGGQTPATSLKEQKYIHTLETTNALEHGCIGAMNEY
jgi:hypothetical protein